MPPETNVVDTNSLCRKCGSQAQDACGKCKTAFYCSKNCQLWDWRKGGHKSLCRGSETNQKIHIILRELFAAEYKWLKDLTRADKQVLLSEDYQTHPLNHIFISGEVALVLARGNACALLANAMMHSDEFGFEYYKRVLENWYNRHKEFLNEQGLYVDYLTHPIFVNDPDQDDEAPPINCNCSNGVAIVRDATSPLAPLVDKIIMQERVPTKEDWTKEDMTCTMVEFMKCLSFPTKGAVTRNEGGSNVAYMFRYPIQVFGGDDVCCSAALKIRLVVGEHDAVTLGTHFHACYEAMRSIGFPLMLDIRSPDRWSNKGIAEALLALSGGDADTFEYWNDSSKLPFCINMSRSRFAEISEMVYDVEDGVYDESGLEEMDIELVMSQAGCSRSLAVKALNENEGDLIDSIMSIAGE